MIHKNMYFFYILVCSLYFIFPHLSIAATDTTTVNTAKPPTVIVIPITGTVDAGMAAFITRALRDAAQYPDRVIILEMDTFGGQVDAAYQIVDTMVNVQNTTIAYVKTKAISAGALIALSCNKLYMKKSTTIGDVAPLMYSNNGPQMLGEKFQSPLRAKFRSLAKRNGYPEQLTEAMVSEDITIHEVRYKDSTSYIDSIAFASLTSAQKKDIVSSKIIIESGELLTMDDVEAYQFGFSKKSVDNFSMMLEELDLASAEVIRVEESWSETFVRIVGTIAPVLMMIGFAALYIEIRSPGFGVPGIIGITCLAIVFLSQYMAGLADYTELLLITIGIILLAIEVFVLPGFGIAGFGAILFLTAGFVLSFQDFVIPDPDIPWQADKLVENLIRVIGSALGSVVFVIMFFKFIFPKLGLVIKGPYLQATLQDASSVTLEQKFPQLSEGGIAFTSLHPSGKAVINGETFDVITEGEFIDKGTQIRVSSISGNRITVQRRTDI